MKIRVPTLPSRATPAVLLIAACFAYGLIIWELGFYWDDLPISWIRYQMGPEALRLYFSTSRPVWGELYQITTSLIPQNPLYWQIFGLFWRWLGAVTLWFVVRNLWPNRPKLAFVISLAFLLYPGFNQQWVSFLTSHLFIVLCFYLFSYLVMFWSFQHPKGYWGLTLTAMFFSAMNLWMLEFFFFLELLRPVVIYLYLQRRSESGSTDKFHHRMIQTALKWIPYLLVFIANTLYRGLVFSNLAYQNVLLAELRADPAGTVYQLLKDIVSGFWITAAGAWSQVFQLPDSKINGPITITIYALVVILVGSLCVIAMKKSDNDAARPALQVIGLGILAILLGGGPYWLAKLELSLGFPNNRFNLSFALGVSLVFAGLVELLPRNFGRFVAAILLGLAAGRQFLWANDYRLDWSAHKNYFWQMVWRAPGLAPDTLVFSNEALSFYADNSMGAVLNWVYAPDNHTTSVDYALFYPTNRIGGSLPVLEAEVPIQFRFLAGTFHGNTSESVAFYYAPPGCLRLLDPEIDPSNHLIPTEGLLKEAAALSNRTLIMSESIARMPEVYGPEPDHGWCYYFERADLARQMKDWEQVVELGETAFGLNDHPNDPLERFVFIEGYAHQGDWDRAVELSMESYRVSRQYMGPLLCRLWNRIDRETSISDKKDEIINQIETLFACNS